MTLAPRTALATGLAYFGLGVAGVVRTVAQAQQIHVPGDAAATAANLALHTTAARLTVAADLTIVIAQVAAALAFFALFRRVHVLAAVSVAALGLINAVLVLAATVFSGTALHLLDGAAVPAAATERVQMMYDLNVAGWNAAMLFFGLWLLPMGYLTLRGGLPRVLGWLLLAGGAGYVLACYVTLLSARTGAAVTVPPLLATVGEVWMIAYLIVAGLRRAGAEPVPAA
ncbi:DUF4386 domain-containing protein [Mangrovihabitans endophyticus]|uniref:DUF4386 domain-containing protein n=1 Tax=Mangrovihabitans endophyticus TaxID=1751298 RepID=A0A8J3BWI2_9ACTN|nr:DUF4386 domain-containing protein [Mangrovihabitans endophyticus]GGK75547.1 hypothetical protein GCM10012284_06930 [Mangrovihabitans endophyticus]